MAATSGDMGVKMVDRLAVKRLTASDLTFFESQFRKLSVGNQKSINLNADVFIEQLYENLPTIAAATPGGDVVPVSLTIHGPGIAPPYPIARSITKREAYKNWRLNGEFVRDPEDQPGRFDNLVAGDLAVFDFLGDPIPRKLTLVVVSSVAAPDAALFAGLNPLIPGGKKTMVRLTRSQLAAAAATSAENHPIKTIAADLEFQAALEDAALGGATGAQKLAAKTGAPVSAATLAAAKAAAEKNGRDGEALAWIYLQELKAQGEASDIEWVASKNAVSPFDFSATIDGVKRKIDAKSTSGQFERPIHMSIAELNVAAAPGSYDIWRVYQMNEDGARLRIAKDIAATAKAIIAGISVPAGVTIDSVSIDPASLSWGEEIVISRPDEDDAGG